MLNIAMADAGIVAWDAKYGTDIDLWRPDDAIHESFDDGIALTVADPNWQPLANLVGGFTPPFPAYTSGHATFGAAHAAVLADFYGSDLINITLSTDEPGSPDRDFTSFTQMALENGRSRVYLGVHYQWDADDGYTSGTALGHHVAANFFQPVPEPGTMALAFTGCVALVGYGIRKRRAARQA